MEKPPSPGFVISFSIVAVLTVASFASCMAAEFNRTKKEDLKLNGRLCFLPESEAFKLGVGGLVCLIMAQIIGNAIICHSYWPKEHRKSCSVKRPMLSIALLISWVSFGIAVVMMSGATSMSRRQEYGKGWVEGECYVVKDGIFVGAAVLVLINGGSTISSAAIGRRTNHVKGPNQIHAQIG
ncbi:protein MODIFYING WALL LIGNIN-1 [Benincasa hispida]|uniref:protein MODIFYING WALL LIGNIN-1 n=1 Tax=Benincasa hispida TaxID=102211 RepID=UPI001900CBF4|nr:protein MODIFYING WALL LIGNIN-1 [Benincasa hispida]